MQCVSLVCPSSVSKLAHSAAAAEARQQSASFEGAAPCLLLIVRFRSRHILRLGQTASHAAIHSRPCSARMQEAELRPLARSSRRTTPRAGGTGIGSSRTSMRSRPTRRDPHSKRRYSSSSDHTLEWQLQTLCVLLCVVVVTLIFQLSLRHSRTRRARPGVRIGRKSLICTNYKREHAQPAFNSTCIPTVLASYPGSGSTITRLLIEMTTGVWTGSIYGDESLYMSMPHPFCGEMTTRNVVAIKSHGPWEGQPTVEFAKRAVLMLRSPFNAIPSYYNWFNTFYKKGSKALQHQKQAPEEEWIQWRGNNVRNQTEYWTNHFSYWVERFNHSDALFVAKFDDLVNEKTGPYLLSDIARFLDFPSEHNRTKEIWHHTIHNRSSAVRRDKSYKPTYTKDQINFIVAKLKELKRKYGRRNKVLASILDEYLAGRNMYLDKQIIDS